MIFRITTEVVRTKDDYSALDFSIDKYLGNKEQNSFWLEAHHHHFCTYLSNKTAAINQTLRSTTILLVGFIYYEPLTNSTDQEIAVKSLTEKHILKLEDISLLSSLNQNCSNSQSINLS